MRVRFPQHPLRCCPSTTQATWFVGTALALLLSFPNVSDSAGVQAARIIAETNSARASVGSPALQPDALLTSAAEARATELLSAAYFDHTRPDGRSFATAVADAGYPYLHVAENLAMDYFDDRAIVRAWLASPTHRTTALNPAYIHVGIGSASGMIRGVPTTIVVQLVGVPIPDRSPSPLYPDSH
jgi:uncharacterized protein YkwD